MVVQSLLWMLLLQPVIEDRGVRLDKFLTRLEGLGFSGGAVAVLEDQVVLKKGYGLANREAGIPFHGSTLFPLGSVTKPLTGAAIVRLHFWGDLDVEDPITDYFDGVPEDKESIQLHHLLTHSSGLPGAIGHDFELIECDEYVRQALRAPLAFEPGNGYQYSNVGYALLAAVLEQITGMTYEEFTREELFEPAGMSRTTYQLKDFDPQEFAHGSRNGKSWGSFYHKPWRNDGPSWHLMGNGGIHSTLDDVLRWHLALADESMMSAVEFELQTEPYVDEGQGDSFYGYGWTLMESSRGTPVHFHTGGNPYFNTDFRRFVGEDAMLFVTTNSSAFNSSPVLEQLERLLFGDTVALPPETRVAPEAELQSWTGRFRFPGGDFVDVKAGPRCLRVVPGGAESFALIRSNEPLNLDMIRGLAQTFETMFAELANGNFTTARKLSGGNPTDEQLTRRYESIVGGPLPRAEQAAVAGCAPRPEGGFSVFVRDVHGTCFELGLLDGKIRDIEEAMGFQTAVNFYPQAENSWVAFQLARTPITMRSGFQDDGRELWFGRGARVVARSVASE